MRPGIHLVHKPAGPTSFSLVQAELDRTQGEGRRVKLCHGGTLDPFASGLLLILSGDACKLFEYLHEVPKVYEATVSWGVETDNGDPLGRIIFKGGTTSLTRQGLEDALDEFVGWREQVPPATSAKRIGGERAYEKAHRGELFELPPSRVYLHEARWLEHDLPRSSRLRLVTRGGYYVRALARDLGRTLGCGAHLSALHRVSIGPWEDPGAGGSALISGSGLVPWMPWRELNDEEVGALRQGSPITMRDLKAPQWRVPAGFPEPASLVRGLHQSRLKFLLKESRRHLVAERSMWSGL